MRLSMSGFGPDRILIANDIGFSGCPLHRSILFRAMKCAVTGASGFIGRALTNHLRASGAAVRALSRRHPTGKDGQGVQWFQGDLLDADRMALRTFLDDTDVLFHCAAELSDESAMENVHVEGTRRLIDDARGRVRHWVQLSSCGVYGPVREGLVTEASALDPSDPYECTKLIAEQLVRQSAGEGAFTATVLRPSNVYGETMPNPSLRAWVGAVERGWFFFIGKPGSTATYVHVDDVAEALCRCAEDDRARGGIYNLCAGCTVETFVAAMCRALDRPMPRLRIPEPAARLAAVMVQRLPGFPLTRSRVDALTGRARYTIDRIQHDLGFTPRITAEEGLRRLIQQMQQESRRAA